MATYDPPLDLFRRQIESIRAQTYEDWVCVISDDRSPAAVLAEMRAVLADDERFSLTPGAHRLGFYGNFERALALAPREAELLAMCDQDDRWNPEKLEVLESSMEPGAKLVYSDMRIVDRAGRVLFDTYWTYRRNSHTNFASLVLANTVTGAASLLAREVLDYALPFPPHYGTGYHDHWVALVAMALGDVGCVDRPLCDYVQHGGQVVGHGGQGPGHARANGLLRGAPSGTETASDGRGSRGRLARLARETRRLYFLHYCGTAIATKVTEMRCGSVMAPAKRRTLRRFTRPERTIPWLALRALRPWTGRTETLWREQPLLGGLAWRHCAELRERLRRRATRRRATARAAAGASRGRGRLPCPPWRRSRRPRSPTPPHRRGS
ncbi:MAG: glycosyltransferase [Thermoleophilaceae bacterium]